MGGMGEGGGRADKMKGWWGRLEIHTQTLIEVFLLGTLLAICQTIHSTSEFFIYAW